MTVESSETQAGSSGRVGAIREIPLFFSYRRSDGSWFAEWLYKHLEGLEYLDRDQNRCRLRAYYDKVAPGVSDWKSLHFPSLQSSKALLVVCTPGIARDFSVSGKPDWVYEELRWWTGHRGSAPIIVDTTGEGERWLPELLVRKWPDINRIDLSRADADAATANGDSNYAERIQERILGAIRELEHRTVFEDLERSQHQQRRLRWALWVSVAFLFLAGILGAIAWDRNRNLERQKQVAEAARDFANRLRGEEAQVAQRRLVLVSMLLGGWSFTEMNLNNDWAGLSIGLMQWTQRVGTLAELLRAFQKDDPEAFTQIFGDGDNSLAIRLLEHIQKPNGGLGLRGETTDPKFDLVHEPWLSRFREATENSVFQSTQLRLATVALLTSYERLQKTAPELKSERGFAFALDIAAQYGIVGVQSIYKKVVRPGMLEPQLLQAMEDESVSRVGRQFGDSSPLTASTRARRERFRTTPLLSDSPLITNPSVR
jgi:hypothetical protein